MDDNDPKKRGARHAQRAEQCIRMSENVELTYEERTITAQIASVHASLAVYYAIDSESPENRMRRLAR